MSKILFKVTIPGRAGILKNAKQIGRNPHTGKMFFKSSKRYDAWANEAILYIKQEAVKMVSTINFPINLSAKFYFENRQHEADLSNLYQGVEDLLEDAGVIANDKLIVSHDGSEKIFGSEPRVEIEITSKEETKNTHEPEND